MCNAMTYCLQNKPPGLRPASLARRLGAFSLALMLMLGNVTPGHAATPIRRVNAPHFDGDIVYSEAAIFWFGRVTSTENYADVRVGYNDQELAVYLNIFDRLLWYDPDPTPDTLTAWDSVTLYLDLNGNVGNTPTANTFRFDAQLVDWESPRTRWQAAYQGNGSSWTRANVSFTTQSGYRWESATVGGLDNNQNNRGWSATFKIPFASLSLGAPPLYGVRWGMALALHDRDDGAGTPIADKVWPENTNTSRPATWGQLNFGLPGDPTRNAIPHGTTMIRHKLNGASVIDAAVGGTTGNLCPGDPNYIWNEWGNANFADASDFNIQNQADLADWPCFAKYYITFPLDSIPADKVIVSATLTLHQFGNSGQGWTPPPEPSLIQALTLGENWAESTLTWNNAPLPVENVGRAWADPLPSFPGVPGISRVMDVSRAVAEAYATGDPLRLVLYSADAAMHSGKYFWSSDVNDGMPTARPSLTVVWGDVLAAIHKSAWPFTGSAGHPVTYTLDIMGNGQTFTVTDALPTLVSRPGAILVTGGTASYNPLAHRILWTGTLLPGQRMTLTFPVTPTAAGPAAVHNSAILADSHGNVYTATHTLMINSLKMWLPLVLRR